jgi:shikimate kinase
MPNVKAPCDNDDDRIAVIKKHLPPHRSIVFVGMMGAGKSTVGRKIAFKLGQDFVDTDVEIERSAQLTISEIFSLYGETHFREIEQKIICRLLNERCGVISVGGGAFMNQSLRDAIKEHGISVWLKADFNILMDRVHRHEHRPLLDTDNPEDVMRRLIDTRYPIYEQSDIIVNNSHHIADMTVDHTLTQLAHYMQDKFA